MKKEFIEVLKSLYSLTGAAKLAHWNIEGVDFYHFHLLFERIYTTIDASIDGIAEQARGCQVEIPALIFNSVPETEWSTPTDLCKKLNDLNDDLILKVKSLRRYADTDQNFGVVAITENLLADCNTVKYLLKSALESL